VVRRDNPQEPLIQGDCHEERRPRSYIAHTDRQRSPIIPGHGRWLSLRSAHL
jgi:hypothetical protein